MRRCRNELSAVRDADSGIFVICANPLFVVSAFINEPGTALTFEVFKDDTASLELRLNRVDCYHLDPGVSEDACEFYEDLSTCEQYVLAGDEIEQELSRRTIGLFVGPNQNIGVEQDPHRMGR